MFFLAFMLFLAPPSTNIIESNSIYISTIDELKDIFDELNIEHEPIVIKQEKNLTLEFVETKFRVISEDKKNGEYYEFSIWMPTETIDGTDFVFVNKAGLITGNSVILAQQLLKSI